MVNSPHPGVLVRVPMNTLVMSSSFMFIYKYIFVFNTLDFKTRMNIYNVILFTVN